MAADAPGPVNKWDVDAIDRGILEYLQRDGRMAYTALAKELGVSEGTIRQRVSRLQSDDILRIVALCNPLTLGHQSIRFLVRTRELSPRAVASILRDLPSVAHVGVCAGSYQLFLEATCRDQHQLIELQDQIRATPGVADLETLILLSLTKDYSWSGLLHSIGQDLSAEESR
jgi:Lrp/AsnC family transcriptional regulator for asnA, asnC and gidA